MTANHLKPDANGEVAAPDAPGLGITVSTTGARKYLQDVDIRVNGRQLFATAKL
jgi:L-alanine-DL-glutamate epimerase-like enolase superfamily enzyme